jgi:hypothetical protein
VYRQRLEDARVLRGHRWGDDWNFDWNDWDLDDWYDWGLDEWDYWNFYVWLLDVGEDPTFSKPSTRNGLSFTINPLRDHFHFFGRRGAREGVTDMVTFNLKRALVPPL